MKVVENETSVRGKRRLMQFKDGELVNVWSSMHEAQKHNFTIGGISRSANGETKHRGFTWRYVNEKK